MNTKLQQPVVLVAGGLGYIGTHLLYSLIAKRVDVIVTHSKPLTVEQKALVYFLESVALEVGSVFITFHGDPAWMDMSNYQVQELIYLRGSKNKATQSSIDDTIAWFDTNIEHLVAHGLKRILYASSGSVYKSQHIQLSEQAAVGPIGSYAQTKLTLEKHLQQLAIRTKMLKIVCLRYFNPVAGYLSAQSDCIEKTIMDCLRNGKPVPIYTDSVTKRPDGFVRDYILMEHLVAGTLQALEFLRLQQNHYEVFNIGSGVGLSTRSLINVYENWLGVNIPSVQKIVPSDVMPTCQIADVSKARNLLGFDPRPL